MFFRTLGLCSCLALSACNSYYGQLASGQWHLWQQQQNIEQLLQDQAIDPQLRQRLERVREARDFAHTTLALPNNGSYQQYVALDRPYVVWNLLSTAEFSIEANTQCFPIAGCVAYRGYFSQDRARGAAALLRKQGMDTVVLGVDAYSTLGWLADPLLSSMLKRRDEQLVGVIFHELAHQQYYVAGDTAFNESFASFVEHQGLQQWNPNSSSTHSHDEHRQAFTRLILNTREELAKLYQQPLSAPAMRSAKEHILARLRSDYRALRAQHWPTDMRYEAWINGPLNNASLLPFGLYDQWLPAFAELFQQQGKDWPAFYRAVERLGSLPEEQRHAALQQLQRRAELAEKQKPEH